ncbi:MAG: YraN family protein [Flavobacteriia bacterium]|nr:YraN family protein [Flavobacteriia bacterium]
MADHNLFGIEAEKQAADYLAKKGYEIIERNWTFLKAEIDIIARDPEKDELVIVEVKARKKDPLVLPELAVNKKKRRLLITAADEYIVSNEIDLDCRFDIISIEKSKDEWFIDHIENAFFSFE